MFEHYTNDTRNRRDASDYDIGRRCIRRFFGTGSGIGRQRGKSFRER
jgi:hypothetical protein